MRRKFSIAALMGLAVLMLAVVSVPAEPASAVPVPGLDVTYTLDADFDQGILANVNHDTPNNDQLQLNTTASTFPFVWVALSLRCTIAKLDTNTGAILGEYRTVSDGAPCAESSRTTVGLDGSVWVGHRGVGGVTHVGHESLFQCVDRDGSTAIETSTGYGDVKPWPGAISDVSVAEDECIIHHVDTVAAGLADSRHMSIDDTNNLWVGDFAGGSKFVKVDGNTGTIISPVSDLGCGGYGGLIDANGVIWSASGGGPLLRWDPNAPLVTPNADLPGANPRCYSIPSYGVAIDPAGWVWTSGLSTDTLRKVSPDGLTVLGPFVTGGIAPQGLAVTSNGDVWLSSNLFCSGGVCPIGHHKNTGVHIGNVPNPTGDGSTGVSVDANGKVWTVNRNANTATRIDPTAGPLGTDAVTPVGAVDLTVPFPAGPGGRPLPYPYNYSDMTGTQLLTSTAPQGTWTVVQDGGSAGVAWGTITWNNEPEGSVPLGTSITVEARASDSEVGLGSESYVPITHNVPFSLVGRYIQVRATLRPDSAGVSPVMSDLRIQAEQTGEADFEKISVDVDGPAEIDVSEDVVVTVTSVVANNGPDSGTASDTLSVSAPFDCEVTPAQYTDQVVLEPQAQQTITHTFTIHCFARSHHIFPFCNSITATEVGDPDPQNNGPLCDNYTVAAIEESDVKVTAVAVTAPATATAGVPFNVGIDATVHNNGPITPLQGEGGIGLAVPPGCTANPNVPYQLVNPINNLMASVSQTIHKDWQVTCDFPGVYNFVACGRAGPLTLHVRDSQTNNNFMWTPFTVEVMAEEPGPDPNAGRCSILGDPPENCDNGIDDDGDTEVDEEPDFDADGASDCVDPDDDGDGYSDATEAFVGTDPLDVCADSLVDPAFPPDFNNDRSVSISDVLTLKASFNTSDGDSAYSQRNDVDASGTINISDVLALKGPFGTSCS